MFAFIKNVVKVIETRKENIHRSPVIGTFGDYPIFLSNKMLACFCNIGPHIPGILIYKSPMDGSEKIVVNDSFQRLPDNIKKAMYYHEVGHSALEHLELISKKGMASYKINLVNDVIFGQGNYLSLEFEADKYAASIVGVAEMVNALETLKKALPDYLSKRLITHRINKVLEYGAET